MTIPAAAPADRTPRALVVEDDADVSQLLRTHLRRLGWDVSASADGEDALVQAVAEVPDLVVLDIVLPGIDGVAVLRGLREHEATRGCRVVATTMLESADLCGAGVDAVLPKPFTRRDVARLLPLPPTTPSPTTPSPTTPSPTQETP